MASSCGGRYKHSALHVFVLQLFSTLTAPLLCRTSALCLTGKVKGVIGVATLGLTWTVPVSWGCRGTLCFYIRKRGRRQRRSNPNFPHIAPQLLLFMANC